MEYDDFPILNENEYAFLNDKFNEQKTFNRSENVYTIFCVLNESLNALPFLMQEVNPNLRQSLTAVQQELNKIKENFNAIFNFKENNKEIKQINLFNFLKNVVILQKNSINWQKFEQKEYFKQFSCNLIAKFNDILLQLMSGLENANIKLFKYM